MQVPSGKQQRRWASAPTQGQASCSSVAVKSLPRRPSAVDRKDNAGHVAARRGGQEKQGRGQFVWRAKTPQRYEAFPPLRKLWISQGSCSHVGVVISGRDGVRGDSERSPLDRLSSGQANKSVLAGDI